MKHFLALILSLLTLSADAALWSFKVPLDGLSSNGVPYSTLTNALAPTFTPASGDVPLDISVVSVGNMVYVTTNGATPTTNLTPLASGSLVSVTSTNQPLRAIAWTNDGFRLPSTVTSASYTNIPAAPPGPALWISQEDIDDGAAWTTYNINNLSQGITNTTGSSIYVTRVGIYGSRQVTDCNVYLQFRTTTNSGGSLLGGYSTTNLAVNTSDAWLTNFVFATPVEIPANTHAFLTLKIIEDAQWTWVAGAMNQYSIKEVGAAKDADYKVSITLGDDFCFKIWTNEP